MKKILALSVALALIGSAVFAQTPAGLKIGAHIKTGFEVFTPDDDAADTDTTVRVYDNDSNNVARLRLNLEYVGENWGFFGHIRTTAAEKNPLLFGTNWVAYSDLFNGLVRVSAGNDDFLHPFRTGGFYGGWAGIDTHFHPQWKDPAVGGLFTLVIKPIEGLSVGYNFIPYGLVDPLAEDSLHDARIGFAKSTVGLAYATGPISAQLQLNFDATADADNAIDQSWVNLVYGLKYASGPLTVALDGVISNMGKDEETDSVTDVSLSPVTAEIDLKAGYNITDALKAELVVGIRTYGVVELTEDMAGPTGDGKKAAAVPVLIMPVVQYTFSPSVLAGFGASFIINGGDDPDEQGKKGTHTYAVTTANPWSGNNGNGKTRDDSIGWDGFSTTLTPYINFTISKGCNLVVYDELHIAKEIFSNNFGVNTRWTF